MQDEGQGEGQGEGQQVSSRLAAAVHISPHMRNTGLSPHIPGLMELAAASRRRKRDCLEFISKMSEDDLKDITTAVKERMEVVKPSKKKVKK